VREGDRDVAVMRPIACIMLKEKKERGGEGEKGRGEGIIKVLNQSTWAESNRLCDPKP
jgi:hypothetical protein